MQEIESEFNDENEAQEEVELLRYFFDRWAIYHNCLILNQHSKQELKQMYDVVMQAAFSVEAWIKDHSAPREYKH